MKMTRSDLPLWAKIIFETPEVVTEIITKLRKRFLRSRRAASPVVATSILIGVGLFLALTVSSLYRETAFSSIKVEAIEYPYIYCATRADIDNARWKIVFKVNNRGTQSVQLNNLYVNDREVDVYNLVHGEKLSDGSLIGTSFPDDGLNLSSGESVEIYVWIGDDLFSSGTYLVINLNSINSVTQNKTVKLS